MLFKDYLGFNSKQILVWILYNADIAFAFLLTQGGGLHTM